MKPLRITVTPGLPPVGTPGQFLGYDAEDAMWLLRWDRKRSEWTALGHEQHEAGDFPVLRLGPAVATLIVGHVEGPAIRPAGRSAP